MQNVIDAVEYFCNSGNFQSEEWRQREMNEWFQLHLYELKAVLDSMSTLQTRYGNAILALEALKHWPVIAECKEDTDAAWARNVIESGLNANLRK